MADVNIKLKPKKQKEQQGERLRRGALPDRRDPDQGPRRLGGGINWWDMGQVWNGSAFEDINFRKLDDPGNLSVALGVGGHVSASFDSSAGAQTYHDLFRAKIFEIDEADWKSSYYKFTFEEAELYGVELRNAHLSDTPTNIYPVARNGSRPDYDGNPITDTKWTKAGLKIPGNLSSFGVQPFGAFWYFDNSDKFKITQTPDYSATAVGSFTLSNKADIFLIPNIVNIYFEVESSDFINTNALFAAYAPLSREFWLSFGFTGAPNGLFNKKPTAFTLTSGQKTTLQNHARTDRAPSRDFNQVLSGAYTENSAGTFPAYSTNYVAEIGNDLAGVFSTKGTALNNFAGRLVGVIKQSGNTYYFWTGGTGGVLTQSNFGRWSFQ